MMNARASETAMAIKYTLIGPEEKPAPSSTISANTSLSLLCSERVACPLPYQHDVFQKTFK